MPSTPGSLSFGGASTRVEANNSNVAVLGGTGYKPAMVLERTDGTAFSLGKIDFGGNIIDATSDWAEKIRITDITTGGSGNSLISPQFKHELLSADVRENGFCEREESFFRELAPALSQTSLSTFRAVYDPQPAAAFRTDKSGWDGCSCVGSIFISQRKRNASIWRLPKKGLT